jgi:hypothetical protein
VAAHAVAEGLSIIFVAAMAGVFVDFCFVSVFALASWVFS